MRYIDPMPLTCYRCGTVGSYRTADLFALTARCAACGGSFDAVGQQMRRAADEFDKTVFCVEIVIRLEDALGLTITDEQSEHANTPA